MSEDHVLYDVRDGVATLTLNRPTSRNALTDEMQGLLIAYTRQAENDPAVRCLVLRGAGRAFMAGGDVKGMVERIEQGGASAADITSTPAGAFTAWRAEMFMRSRRKPSTWKP